MIIVLVCMLTCLPCPLPHRAERVKRAKQRQREWLVRLYRSEAVQEALGTGKLEPGCKLEEALAFGTGEDLEDDQVCIWGRVRFASNVCLRLWHCNYGNRRVRLLASYG